MTATFQPTTEAACTTLVAHDSVDWQRVCADFPILSRTIHGKRMVYLDSTASSQKPEQVIDALSHFYRTSNANIHRGAYTLSEEATHLYEQARRKVARFINAAAERELIFTRNATEALNLVAHSWARANLGAGDVIVTSEMEHHSNLIPWQVVARETGARLEFIPIKADGSLDLAVFDELLKLPVKLVSVVHVSNTLGTINPITEIVRRAKAVGAVVVVDGAQSVPHMPVDVQELGCDFLAFSGHKMCAPSGIGALWGRFALLDTMQPFLTGGGTVTHVGLRECAYEPVPARFEAGTPAFAEAIAFGAAVDYLSEIGMGNIREHERALAEYALARFTEVAGLQVYGHPDAAQRGATFPFNLGNHDAATLAAFLESEGIAVRAGRHCCQPIMDHLGVSATARASFYLYNNQDDVDVLVAALKQASQLTPAQLRQIAADHPYTAGGDLS